MMMMEQNQLSLNVPQRIDDIIEFNCLNEKDIKKIIEKEKKELKEKYNNTRINISEN